jgi:hypothetical protein
MPVLGTVYPDESSEMTARSDLEQSSIILKVARRGLPDDQAPLFTFSHEPQAPSLPEFRDVRFHSLEISPAIVR